MQLRVSPTRMSLLRLKRRLEVARRGHRLLKDKLEGLTRAFLPLVEQYVEMRARVDRELPRTLGRFVLTSALAGESAVTAALEEAETRLDAEMTLVPVMSVPVPELTVHGFELKNSYSMVTTPADFDDACAALRRLFPTLLELAALEEAVTRMAAEIERTRRRVNALEHVLVPSLTASVRSIAGKLEESERASRARLMKIKDVLAGASGSRGF